VRCSSAIPQGASHAIWSAEGAREKETAAIVAQLQTGELKTIQAGGGGEVTRFVCGYIA
jgi:hypothetical protein